MQAEKEKHLDSRMGLRIMRRKNGNAGMLSEAEAAGYFIMQAEIAFNTGIKQKLPKEEVVRDGGYLCVAPHMQNGVPFLVALVGTVPELKAERCRVFAEEKVARLNKHPEHVSSWQSRDPAASQWGGAIVAGDYVLSFSGLPEDADEALMLFTAIRLGLIPTGGEKMSRILDASNNRRYDDLFPRLTKPPALIIPATH